MRYTLQKAYRDDTMMHLLKDKNLLFLEDNEDFIEDAARLFYHFFQNVFTAKTILEAKELFHAQSIDLIVSDVHLRRENGLDFIEHVRQNDRAIPIVVLSGYKDESLLLRAIPLGLSGYLIKPINFKSLSEVFEKCAKTFENKEEILIKLKEELLYDTQRKVILKEKVPYELNKKEILFFEMAIQNKNKIFTKEMFAHFVYENNDMSDSALTNFIMRLRKRFGKDFLHTVADVGYKMVL